MSVLDTILEKRGGGEHSRSALEELVFGSVAGDVPDYQLSAWLMAVYFQGLTAAETGMLTDIMIRSGATIDLSSVRGPLVDKHSTGGVGDKVSLVLAPMVSACGLSVPMMSGRGLGHTGGTLDKLESIPGYTTSLSQQRFCEVIRECGYAMTGQSSDIVPADRLMYALRDVTGTVESIPLITASILSKKFAEGAHSLVFDVKCGRGAFMKNIDEARALATSLLSASRSLDRPVAACITRMDAPLGRNVGNLLEVEESLDCLAGRGPEDLMEVTYRLGGWMLLAGGKAPSVREGEDRCREAIRNGSAFERFRRNVLLQGGHLTDESSGNEKEFLASRRSPPAATITAGEEGMLSGIDSYALGRALIPLGAGRSRTDDRIDHGAGIILAAKPGDNVCRGDELATVFASPQRASEVLVDRIRGAFEIEERGTREESSGRAEHQSEEFSPSMILEEIGAL